MKVLFSTSRFGEGSSRRLELDSHLKIMLVMLFVFGCSQVTFGKVGERDLLNTPVTRLNIKAKNIHLALSQIANEYDVPIGLEVAGIESKEHSIKVHIKDGTLREVLTSIVRQDPQYDWAIMDGVVNVFPTTNRDGFLRDVLAATVRKFHIARGTGRFDIKVAMTDLPEVRSLFEKAKLTPSIAAFFNRDYLPLGPEFSLDSSNVSLRTILNLIIGKSSARYWVVSRSRDSRKSVIINF